jgi:hypothetical protein
MTRVTAPPTDRPKSYSAQGSALKVSPYERAASLLVSLLILVGAGVLLVFLLWLLTQIVPVVEPVPIVIEDVGGGTPDGVVGESMEIDSPDAEQIAQESELTEPQIEQTLDMIEAVVATQLADLTDPSLTEELESGGSGRQSGDGRQPGFGFGDGEPGLPRSMRWSILFPEGSTLAEYGKQLAFFKIELAAVAGDQVDYAFNLAKSKPDSRRGAASAEERLTFEWREGTLREADRSLLGRAGVDVTRRRIVQVYPPDVESKLAVLEKQFKGLDGGQIRKTRFGVRAAGAGYEFYVIDQTPL